MAGQSECFNPAYLSSSLQRVENGSRRYKLFTYTAPTFAEAMEIAKQKHGDDALMVSNREIKKKSLLENGLYEVVIVDRKPKDSVMQGNSQRQDIKQSAKDDDKPDNDIAKRLDKIAQKELAKRREETQSARK